MVKRLYGHPINQRNILRDLEVITQILLSYLHIRISDRQAVAIYSTSFSLMAGLTSMEPAEVVGLELTDLKKQSCSRGMQEPAGETLLKDNTLNLSEKLPKPSHIKREEELDNITVKEEPIEWHQIPQVPCSVYDNIILFILN
ncbi:hypothetical protein FHG87_016792 [Trinorchestia longiramus]|nr:hypothetical protein FHG87_016792 [Trinorchestia longiramus]